MHEISLMQAALDLALKEMDLQGCQRIHRITLAVGALAGVVPDALEFALEVLSKGTPAEGATLAIETVAITCNCNGCLRIFEPEGLRFTCPYCGSQDTRITAGRELELTSLEVS